MLGRQFAALLRVLLPAMLAVMLWLPAAWGMVGQKLYSVTAEDAQLRVIDPLDASTLESVDISLEGHLVTGAQCLATDPDSGKLFAILVLDGLARESSSRRALVTLDPNDGAASLIGEVQGNTSALRNIGAMAFNADGDLFAATMALPAGPHADKLYSLDSDTAVLSLLAPLRGSINGLALAFDPESESLTHISGPEVFERIGLEDLERVSGKMSPMPDGHSLALAPHPEGGFLYATGPVRSSRGGRSIYPVSLSGEVGGSLGQLDHLARGLAFHPPLRYSGTAGDLDGDADGDILWRHEDDGVNRLWVMAGPILESVEALPDLVEPGWGAEGLADFTGDGVADVLWRNSNTGDVKLWLVEDGERKKEKDVATLEGGNWAVAGLGDMTGDGRADIFWHDQSSSENMLWEMNGAQLVAEHKLDRFPGRRWRPVGFADFNGDGKADILWRHINSGGNRLWLMNGPKRVAALRMNGLANSDWQVAAVGDFDGDGKADALWRNMVTGANRLWLLEGAKLKTKGRIPRLTSIDWRVAGTSDYDGDGISDLLWRNSLTGANRIWLMQGLERRSVVGLPKLSDVNWQVVR